MFANNVLFKKLSGFFSSEMFFLRISRDFVFSPVSRHFPYSKDFVVSPVSRHFPYSRDLVVSPVSRHFWKRLEGQKVGRLEGWMLNPRIQRILLFILFPDTLRIQGIWSFLLFPDTFGKGWKVRRLEGWKAGRLEGWRA